ncbi:MAG: hypothetical protein Tsb002_27010 [Wenzhouxiangellaceae bacterium]
MKIRPKVTLFTSIFLILMLILLEVLSVYNIKHRGEARLAAYREEALNDIKEHLRDLVDIAYETVDKNYSRLSDPDYLSNIYDTKLNNIIDAGESIIRRYQRQAVSGQLSIESAKRQAIAEIRDLRFDNGTGYIWINDTGKPFPRMVMHPTVPALDGEILDSAEFNNAQGTGKNLFQAFVEVTENSDDGYVDYLWPKPTPEGLTEEVPKLSYVRRYNEWGWILGTGIYLDDAEADIRQRIKDSVKTMRYANGTGYFWINDDSEPYTTMIMHPTIPELDGTVLSDRKYNNALGRSENLFNAFVQVTREAPHSGYVDYLWPKPTADGLTEPTEKISYVRLHRPLGWIIGSGVYIDTIEETLAAKRREIDSQVNSLVIQSIAVALLFISIAIAVSYLFSNTLAGPIVRLTKTADEISHGKKLEVGVPDTDRTDEIGELAKSVDRLRASTKIMMQRLMKKA